MKKEEGTGGRRTRRKSGTGGDEGRQGVANTAPQIATCKAKVANQLWVLWPGFVTLTPPHSYSLGHFLCDLFLLHSPPPFFICSAISLFSFPSPFWLLSPFTFPFSRRRHPATNPPEDPPSPNRQPPLLTPTGQAKPTLPPTPLPASCRTKAPGGGSPSRPHAHARAARQPRPRCDFPPILWHCPSDPEPDEGRVEAGEKRKKWKEIEGGMKTRMDKRGMEGEEEEEGEGEEEK